MVIFLNSALEGGACDQCHAVRWSLGLGGSRTSDEQKGGHDETRGQTQSDHVSISSIFEVLLHFGIGVVEFCTTHPTQTVTACTTYGL
jgi:hypothetical protein